MFRSVCYFLIVYFLFSQRPEAQTLKLTADRLFDGSEMRQGWGLILEGNQIREVGPINELPATDEIRHFEGGTLMPGLIEGHSHVLLYPYNQTDWNDQVLKESTHLRAIRGAMAATKNLHAGFTTIRDLGSEGAGYADVAIKESIELGIVAGPRMLVAGPAIVATGSYGPKGFRADANIPLGAQPADGPDLIRVTREQIGKGADFIKVYADYRWGPNKEAQPTFSIEELKLIVETAASSNRVVVAHAATAEGMRRATLAGVQTIEHGTAATPEVLALMKEKGVALCPTLGATYSVTQYREGWDGKSPEPPAIQQKRQQMKLMLKSGVKILAGGDVGVFPHGKNVLELELMVDYGMKPIEVLRSVTKGNADILGLKRVGQLKANYLADVVVVQGNPEEDISCLYKVMEVIIDGDQVVKPASTRN